MPPVIVPPAENGSEAYLLALFRQTEMKLIREIARKRGQGYVDYAEIAALERVRRTLQRMTGDAEKYVPLMIEHEFYQGKEAAAGYANAQAMINPGRSRAIEILTDNLLGQVEEMAQTAYQATASKLFLIGRLESDPFRDTVIEKAAESLAEGRGSLSKTEEIIRAVQEQGITAFVDKAGHEWSLSSYGNMAVRTTVRQAQVASVLTEDDHDLYKILAIGSTCPICAVYEGRVYSKSGTSPFYPPLSDAFGKIDPAGANDLSNSFLNIHPNCLHTLVPYTEKGKTPKQVEKERRFSNPQTNPYNHDPRSKKQKAAYEAKERNRAEHRANVKQFQKYTQAGVPGMPKNYQTFEKHKKLNDDTYREWVKKYRGIEKPKPQPVAVPKAVRPSPVTVTPKPLEAPQGNVYKPEPIPKKEFVSQFKPAESIADAEKYAERFTDKNGFGALGVSYKGVDLEIANKVNKTLGDFYDEFDVKKFGGVIAPAGNTKLGKQLSSATAAYSPIRNSFILNRSSMKNMKTFREAMSKETDAIKSVLAHPERYDIDRMSKRVRDVIFNSKVSGRGTVPETVEDVLNHELGHSLERAMKALPNYEALKAGMPQFATKISGYAADSFSEYVAESFASYRKGEKLIDPEMVKAFEMLKRK